MYIYEYGIYEPFIRLQLGRGALRSSHSNYSDIRIHISFVTPVNSFYTIYKCNALVSLHYKAIIYLYLAWPTTLQQCTVIAERVISMKKDSKCIK